ncbi:hypothetical protein P0082_02005 [Candidatus Haliotispira prima]|uniref:POTRA domain-containing protein n=1 Tax=Candidatus Haliotispira prima TaxID=3034016 RepID=A0ABY8MI10_9SPIO|nr:hypothetical protein P0082_02005 [Candidatus Haliotispira prima]
MEAQTNETTEESNEDSDKNGAESEALSEKDQDETEGTEETLEDDGKAVLIQAIDIRVKGLSSKSILRNRIGVQIGDEFRNLTELQKTLDIGFNDLKRTGYFKKDNGIQYRLVEEGQSEDRRLLRLEAEFRDAWTIYPLPYPYYSTADGYGVKGRLKWDNFLGLLGNVTLYADFIEVRNGNYGWNVSGGLSISTIKITPNFGINGSIGLKRDARIDGANWVINTGIGASFSILWLRFVGIGMGYSVSNSYNGVFGYTGNVTTHPHLSSGLSHSISLGKTHYSSGGVMRDGYDMSLSNSYSFDSDPGNLYSSRAFALEDIRFDYSLKLSRSYFGALNFKGRVGLGKIFDFANGVYNEKGYNYDVHSYNRGKRSGAVKGDFIVYLNMEMAVLVFSDSFLGDVLLDTFLDVAWVHNASGFKLENTSLGSGFELIWAFNSLQFRFTYGFDLDNPELYTIAIATGFFF